MNPNKYFSGFLLLLNSLSLDAAVVAISWQDIVASELEVNLCWHEILILFLVTWLAYAGDHLLDSMQQIDQKSELPRHLFVTQNRQLLGLLWGFLFLVTTLLALLYVDQSKLLIGLGLGVGVAVYFVVCFLFPQIARIIIPRELIVSGVFVAATLFFPLAHLENAAFSEISPTRS